MGIISKYTYFPHIKLVPTYIELIGIYILLKRILNISNYRVTEIRPRKTLTPEYKVKILHGFF